MAKFKKNKAKSMKNLGDLAKKKPKPPQLNQVDVPVTASDSNQSDFPFNETFSTQETPSEDFESRDEITYVDIDLLNSILDYVLNGNNSRRSLSVFILAILKL